MTVTLNAPGRTHHHHRTSPPSAVTRMTMDDASSKAAAASAAAPTPVSTTPSSQSTFSAVSRSEHHRRTTTTTLQSAASASEQSLVSSQHQPTQPVQPQIRHAGRARVRGKIRRTWRPRYLELFDNGLVRYYELPATADIALQLAQDVDHVNMIPKYTLAIFEARILDVTTLRDMPTGLPRGSFGFLFRGQRLLHLEATYQDQLQQQCGGIGGGLMGGGGLTEGGVPVKEQRDFLCAVSSLEEAQMWVVALQWAAHRQQQYYASSSASSNSSSHGGYLTSPLSMIEPWWNNNNNNTPTTINTNTHHHRATSWDHADDDDMLGVQVLDSTYFDPVGGGGSSNLTSPPASAAASRRRNQSSPLLVVDQAAVAKTPNRTTTAKTTTTTLAASVESIATVPRSPSPPPSSTQQQQQHAAKLYHSAPALPSRTSTSAARQSAFRRRPPPQKKVLVCKVAQYRSVRLTGWRFEIAYEIHVLLLLRRANTTAGSSSNSSSSSNHQNNNNNNRAEQWSLLRTADDWDDLVRQLQHELVGHDRHNNPVLAASNSGNTATSSLARLQDQPTASQLRQSLAVLDRQLRTLVMDAAVVNTAAFKSFLGLQQQATTTGGSSSSSSAANNSNNNNSLTTSNTNLLFVPLRWWNRHDAQSIVTGSRTALVLHKTTKADQFVKKWLQNVSAVPQSAVDTRAAWLLQRQQQPWFWASAAAAVGLAVMPRLLQWGQQQQQMTAASGSSAAAGGSMPWVQVRLDVLVVSWMGAAYLGSLYPNWAVAGSSSSGGDGGRSSRTRPTIRQSSARAAAPRNKVAAVRRDHPSASRSSSSTTAAVQKDDSIITVLDDTVVGGTANSVHVGDDDDNLITEEELEEDESEGDETDGQLEMAASTYLNDDSFYLPSPLPKFPDNDGQSCWSQPAANIFHVRGANYLKDKVKIPSGLAPLTCRGVDVWMTDSPQRNISRHPSVLGGKLAEEDTFLVNFLLPFGNLVAYFSIPPLQQFPPKLGPTWTNFLKGDQSYRDARLKLLPVVCEGPWIVKAAVGPGKSPALLGKVIPLQYFFRDPDNSSNKTRKKRGVYEVDVIITASTIAKGILSVVKGHTKSVSIAFAFIIEAAEQSELPETVLCCFQLHPLHLEHCPILPVCDLDEVEE